MISSDGRIDRRRRMALWGLLALASALYVLRIGSPAIFDDSDGIYAETPREMVATGDWITPHVNGVRYLEKPPLLYWLTALSYRAAGISEAAARLPVAASSVATVLLSFLIGEICFGTTAGFWAGLVLATAPGYYLFSQQIMPDTLFTALLALAFYGFLRGYQARGRPFWGYLLFYAGLGLAILAKGLIGLVFPVLTVGAFLVLTRDFRRWREMRPLLGMLILLAIAAPWHVAVGLRNPGFFWFYFINEHVLRFLNRRTPRDYGTVPLLAFWGLHLAWFFPWASLLFCGRREGSPASPTGPQDSRSAERSRLALFPLLWSGSVLLFFSFSTRMEYYSMPAYPAIAILIGAIAARLFAAAGDRPSALRRRWIGACGALSVVGVFSLAAMVALLWLTRRAAETGRPLIDPEAPYNVFFFSPLAHLSLDSMRALRAPIVGVALSLSLGTLLALWQSRSLRHSRRFGPRAALVTLAAMNIALLPWLHYSTCLFEGSLSSRSLAEAVEEHAGPSDRIVVDGQFELYSSLAFYTGRPIYVREGRRGYLEYGSRYADCPPLFLTDGQFRQLWHTGDHVFYVTQRGGESSPALAQYRPIAGSENRVLVDNRVRQARLPRELRRETGGGRRRGLGG